MKRPEALVLRVADDADLDGEELTELTGRLHQELSRLEVETVRPSADQVPEGARGLGELASWLLVNFATIEAARSFIAAVFSWAGRNRSVEIAFGDQVLKVTGVSSKQQKELIDAWLAKLA